LSAPFFQTLLDRPGCSPLSTAKSSTGEEIRSLICQSIFTN